MAMQQWAVSALHSMEGLLDAVAHGLSGTAEAAVDPTAKPSSPAECLRMAAYWIKQGLQMSGHSGEPAASSDPIPPATEDGSEEPQA